MASERAQLPDAARAWPAGPVLAPPALVPSVEPAAEVLRAPDVAHVPVDGDLVDVASGLVPGKALDLGCGEGRDGIWLAQRGWTVTGVDRSPLAVDEARAAAARAGVPATFAVADLADWTPASLFDLVYCTYALPARGMGRSRMLQMAAAAVLPGGTILLSEFDASLRAEGWMAEKYLVSSEELERHLDGFRINRSTVRLARHRHGYDERVLPVATVVATRRTDLRRL